MVTTALVLVPAWSHADPPGYCDGCLDPTFGQYDGRAAVGFNLGGSLSDEAMAVARIPHTGELVVAGRVDRDGAGNWDYGVARLSTEVVFADGFGDGGVGSTGEWSSTVY